MFTVWWFHSGVVLCLVCWVNIGFLPFVVEDILLCRFIGFCIGKVGRFYGDGLVSSFCVELGSRGMVWFSVVGEGISIKFGIMFNFFFFFKIMQWEFSSSFFGLNFIAIDYYILLSSWSGSFQVVSHLILSLSIKFYFFIIRLLYPF